MKPTQRHYRLLAKAEGEIRTEVYMEQDHTVVPVVALMEGVIFPVNAEMPELVLGSELSVAPQGWNGRPLFHGHPADEQAAAISGNNPKTLEEGSFGLLFNSTYANKQLKTEAWINNVRCEEIGAQRVLERLQAGEMVEVSVGCFVVAEEKSGVYNGVPYYYVWHNIVPDHLALLPEGLEGACSIEMGCGAPRTARAHLITAEGINVREAAPMTEPKKKRSLVSRLAEALGLRSLVAGMSDVDVRDELYAALKGQEPMLSYIVAVYDADVVYCCWTQNYEEEYYSRSYQLAADGATVGSERVPVERVVTWEPIGDTAEMAAARKTKDAAIDKKLLQASHDLAHTLGAACAPVSAAEPRHNCSCGGQPPAPKTATTTPPQGDSSMKTKVERVKALIANPKMKFAESMQPQLEQLDDKTLESLEQVAATLEEEPKPKVEPTPAPAPAPAVAAGKTRMSEEEFFATAPEGIVKVLTDLRSAEASKRSLLVGQLKTTQNVYTETELTAMPIDQLEKLSLLTKQNQPVDNTGRGFPRIAAKDDDMTVPEPGSLVAAVRTARGVGKEGDRQQKVN
jgi:hypothetical protein